MNFTQFLEENKGALVGLFLFSQRGGIGLKTPYPPEALSEDQREQLKDELNDCIPRRSLIVDLWNWDIHFEDRLSDDWYFEAAFGNSASTAACAEELADYFFEAVDEWDIDYDQDNDPESFDAMVQDEAIKFVRQWRQNIVDKFTQPAPPGGTNDKSR